ncbi:MAG: hypothetical protein Greene041619_835 [Candidatus Peregrinibacteria bacterium Greene0416_19]|nr:MAG: hypothetical protein Greene041619_835 [Candidatus Peregrinibacteria bacterium Greene0416_19]
MASAYVKRLPAGAAALMTVITSVAVGGTVPSYSRANDDVEALSGSCVVYNQQQFNYALSKKLIWREYFPDTGLINIFAEHCEVRGPLGAWQFKVFYPRNDPRFLQQENIYRSGVVNGIARGALGQFGVPFTDCATQTDIFYTNGTSTPLFGDIIAGFENTGSKPLCQKPVDAGACSLYSSSPVTVTVGQRFNVVYNVKNDGTSTWDALPAGTKNAVVLMTRDPIEDMTFGTSRSTPLSYSVVPGGSNTLTFPGTAPQQPGTYLLKVEIGRETVARFARCPDVAVSVVQPVPTNAAQCIIKTLPQQVIAGQPFDAVLRVGNTGTKTWRSGDVSTEPPPTGIYYLANAGGSHFGVFRIPLARDIFPNDVVDVNVRFTAPAQTGNHPFKFQMVEGGVGSFGGICSSAVTVTAPQDAGECVINSIPSSVTAGQTFDVRMTVRNTGQTTFKAGTPGVTGTYHLMSFDPPDNNTWGSHRIPLSSDVAPGQPVPVTFVARAPSQAGTYAFSYEIGKENVARFGGRCQATVTVNAPLPRANLSLVKSRLGTGPVTPGSVIVYRLTAMNAGPDTATNVSVADPIPSGLTFLRSQSDSRCDQHGGSIICDSMTIPSNDSERLDIAFRVPDVSIPENPICGSRIDNRASVSTSVTDPEPGNNQSNTVSVTVECPSVTFEMSKTDNKLSASPGDEIQYSIAIRNTSSRRATNVTVRDTLPPQLDEHFIETPQGAIVNGRLIVWNNLTVNPNETITLLLRSRVLSTVSHGSVITNIATMDGGPSAQDTTTVNIPLPRANLSLVKSRLGTGPVTPGSVIVYRLTAMNAGPDTATNVSVADSIPSGLSFLRSQSDSRCDQHADKIICDSMTIPSNGSERLDIAFRVPEVSIPENGLCGSRIDNRASVSTSATDPEPGNNQSNTVSVTVECPSAAFTITKDDGRSVVQPGDLLTYTIRVQNTSAVPAPNVTVVDLLGNLLEFDSASDFGSRSGQTVTWSNLSIPAGTTRDLTLRARVAAGAGNGATVTNTARVQGGPSATDNDGVNVPPVHADLSIRKEGPVSVIRGQDTLRYTVTATNAGSATAQNVVIADIIPSGLTFNAAQSPGCVLNSNQTSILCNNFPLASGESRTFTVAFNVPAADNCQPANVTNTATVSSSTTDPVSGNNSVTALPVRIDCPQTPTFTITKDDGRTVVQPGDLLTYTIRVQNTSAVPALNVTVVDLLGSLLAFDSASDNGVRSGQIATWTGLSIPAGTARDLTIRARVSALAGNGATVSNAARVQGGPLATDTNTVSAPTQTGCIAVSKEAYDPLNNRLAVTPQFTFRLENGQTAQNDSAGNAAFTNVPVGQHTVTETVPPSWTLFSTEPTGGVVQVAAGSACAQVRFKNRQVLTNHVTIGKTDNVSSIQPNETLTYQIVLTNTTASVATVTVNDTLPSSLQYLSSSDSGSANGQAVTWSNVSVPALSAKTLTLQVRVNAGTVNGTIITNTAQIQNGPSASDSTTVVSGQNGCISIYKETYDANNNRITSVVPFTFRLDGGTQTVTNDTNGNATFSNVTLGSHTVTETLPTGWEMLSATPVNGVVNVAAGTCAGITFKNRQTAGQTSFTVSKTDDREFTSPNEALTYRIRIVNTGTVQGTVSVTDYLPTYLQFLTASDGGTINGSSLVTWSSVSIAAGQERTLTVQARVASNAPENTLIVNSVQVSTGQSASDSTRIRSGGANENLELSITDFPDPVRAGDELTYTIELRSRDCQARTVDVRGSLDPQIRFLSASDGGDLRRSDEVLWRDIRIESCQGNILRLNVRVDPRARDRDTLRFRARTQDSEDTELTRVIGDVVVIDDRRDRDAHVTASKQADRSEAQPGDQLFYSVTIRNTGTVPARNIMVEDTYDGSRLTVQEGDGASVNYGRVTWQIGTLDAGQTRTLSYRAQLAGSLRHGDTVRNSVSVRGDNFPGSSSSYEVRIVQQLPQTGAGGYTSPIDSNRSFLRSVGSSPLASGGMGAILITLLSAGGVAAGQIVRRRFFI